MNLNAFIHEVYLCGPLTRPDHRVDLLNTGADVGSPNIEFSTLIEYKWTYRHEIFLLTGIHHCYFFFLLAGGFGFMITNQRQWDQNMYLDLR